MIRILAALDQSQFDVPQGEFDDVSVKAVFQIVFAIIGAIAVIILMLASLKYVISRGDPQAVAKAKNTILYAVIGLVISASAFSIVSFVVKEVR